MDFGGLFGVIGHGLVQVVLPAAATALTAVAVKLVSKLARKAHLELTAEQEAQLRQEVQNIIAMVEEKSRQKVMTGPEKQNTAVHALQDVFPDITLSRAVELVQSELPRVRPLLDAGNR